MFLVVTEEFFFANPSFVRTVKPAHVMIAWFLLHMVD